MGLRVVVVASICALAVLAYASAATPGAARGSPGCGEQPPLPTGEAQMVQIDVFEPSLGRTHPREFLLRLPMGYDSAVPLPLVIDIHGYTSDPRTQASKSGFAVIADKHNFVTVWPSGSDDCVEGVDCLKGWHTLGSGAHRPPLGPTCDTDRRTWGYYDCYTSCGCQDNMAPGTNYTQSCLAGSCWDDIGFIESLLAWQQERLCIDLDRVHVTGLSMGALMTYQIAHTFSSRIASIAPVAGLPLRGFLPLSVPTSPVALMDIHGLLDSTIPANVSNGFLGRSCPDDTTCSNDGFYYTPLDTVTAAWAAVNGCSGKPRLVPGPFNGERWWWCFEAHGECSSGASIHRCSGMFGHEHPMLTEEDDYGDVPIQRADFAELAWNFFKKHPNHLTGK